MVRSNFEEVNRILEKEMKKEAFQIMITNLKTMLFFVQLVHLTPMFTKNARRQAQ